VPPCLLTPQFLVRLQRAVGRHTHIEGLFFLCKDKGKGKEAVTPIRHMSSITLCRKQKKTECQIPAVHSCPPVLSLAGITGHSQRFRLSLIVSYMHRIVPSSEMDPVSVQCSAMLFRAMLRCAVQCSVMLYCAVLCCTVPCCAVLYSTVLCHAVRSRAFLSGTHVPYKLLGCQAMCAAMRGIAALALYVCGYVYGCSRHVLELREHAQ
jgi:hypothetical protein